MFYPYLFMFFWAVTFSLSFAEETLLFEGDRETFRKHFSDEKAVDLSANSEAPVQARWGNILKAQEDVTLYSLPGVTDKSFNENSERFQVLQDYDVTELIPLPVRHLKKGDQVEYRGEHWTPGLGGTVSEKYYRLRYKRGNDFWIDGYAPASQFEVVADVTTEAKFCKDCVQNTLCEGYALSSLCQLFILKDSLDSLADFGDQFKSDEERTRYFGKYRRCGTTRLHERYLNEYQYYINEAAEAFQVPEALLACLLFKENQWSEDTSATGAQGVAQIVPSTAEYFNSILKTLELDVSVRNKHERTVEVFQQQVLKFAAKDSPEPISPVDQQRFGFAKRVLKNMNLARDWTVYIERLKATDAFKNKYKNGPPWTGKYPTRFNSQRSNTPALAIGASALYLKDLIQLIDKKYRRRASNSSDQVLHFLTLISGLYNMGPGGAFKLLGRTPPEKFEDWVKALERNFQAKKHMRSIRTCMEKNNMQAPLHFSNGRMVPQRSCQ